MPARAAELLTRDIREARYQANCIHEPVGAQSEDSLSLVHERDCLLLTTVDRRVENFQEDQVIL